MIQKASARPGNTSAGALRHPTSAAGPSVWGSWSGRHYYSIEVVQNPVRARMCGFGDKDRRPLAPAAVCRMVVKRQDSSIVEEDEIDTSFFLVTVDLWSEDGTQEMNLVLHPSSSERMINSYVPNPAKRRKGSADSPPITIALPHNIRPGDSQSSPMPVATGAQNNSQYNYQHEPPPVQEPPQQITFHHHTQSYNTPDPAPAWNHPPPPPSHVNGNGNGNGNSNGSGYSQSLPSIQSFERQPPAPPQPPPVGGEASWHADGSAIHTPTTYRSWSSEGGYAPPPVNHAPASQNGASTSNTTYNQAPPQNGSWSHSTSESPNPNQPRYSQDQYSPTPPSGPANHYEGGGGGGGSGYPPAPYASQSQPPAPPPPPPSNPMYYPNSNYAQHNPPTTPSSVPRQAYTRTLVGPLSANACRLNDEHRKPGIFFLFQDLSIRTEGSFRLRLRLMNVGVPPAPEARSPHTHVEQSPILAQTFTEPFTVYSAKRFPGVPDTTPLSISFGSQGQKLPLRNRHGKSRKRRRGGDDSDASEDDDGA